MGVLAPAGAVPVDALVAVDTFVSFDVFDSADVVVSVAVVAPVAVSPIIEDVVSAVDDVGWVAVGALVDVVAGCDASSAATVSGC